MFVKSMACQAISALEMQLLLPPWLETTVERPSDSSEMLSLALVSFWVARWCFSGVHEMNEN